MSSVRASPLRLSGSGAWAMARDVGTAKMSVKNTTNFGPVAVSRVIWRLPTLVERYFDAPCILCHAVLTDSQHGSVSHGETISQCDNRHIHSAATRHRLGDNATHSRAGRCRADRDMDGIY